jgi:Flp pilus assembly protein TadG
MDPSKGAPTWTIHSFRRAFTLFRRSERGNVASIVAICMMPMLICVGSAVDIARLHNVRAKVQSDLDLALIAAVNDVGTEDPTKISARLNDWFHSQQTEADAAFTIRSIDVDLTKDIVTATASGEVPTALMGIVGIMKMPADVTSSARGTDKPHLQIYFALDKSASMLLAATPEGQAKMQSEVGCSFACHIAEGKVGSTKYKTFFDYSKARKITLRLDVAANALAESLSIIADSDPENSRIKVGLYKLGTAAKEVLAPTLSFSTVRNRLTQDSYGMTSATSDETSYFNTSLSQLTQMVGKAGDGHLVNAPEKLVLVVTDGVQSERDWVFDAQNKVAPLNPKWCADLKQAGVKIAVLYTEYLPMTWDWGYNATVGETMDSAKWKSTWDATRRPSVPGSTTRHDYIPYALKDCASSEDMFISAASASDIDKGIKSLLQSYLSAPRLIR